MRLLQDVLYYVNNLPDNTGRTYFFRSKNPNCSLTGSVRGQLVCLLVIDSNRKLTREEILFSARILQSNGEHYVIRSVQDICEVAKIRGWF